MYPNCRALFIDTSPDLAEALFEALRPEIFFFDKAVTTSLHDALDRLGSEVFHLCFVSGALPAAGITAFMADMGKVELSADCLFVLVKNGQKGSETESLFQATVARQCTEADKAALSKSLVPLALREREVETRKRIGIIDAKVGRLLQEVDETAMDRKRGLESHLNTILSTYVSDLAGTDEALRSHYFDELASRAEDAAALEEFTMIEVPDQILDTKLPKLEKTRYTGQSRRVWKKLQQRFTAGKEGED